MPPPALQTPDSTPSFSSSASSAPQRLTPPSPSHADDDDDLDATDAEAADIEWGESSEHGERSIRLKPLGRGTGAGSKSKRDAQGYRDNYRDHDADDEEDEDGDEEEKGFLGGRSGPSRASTAQDYELYTPDEERAVLSLLDRRLVMFMGLLYMLGFLDRSNIGNAKIAGMSRDLSLSSNQYEWLLTAFYITYIVFEWMTLMYRLIPPHIYIAACVFSWGLIASLQSLCTGFPSLLIMRALLGIAEAAFGPGVPFYLSFFFRRDELAFRTGLFISAAPLSTSFASTLAWLITKLADGGPWAPWRLLFLIEGFPSLLVAVWAWNFVPDGPGEAMWLSARQREVALLRLRKEQDGGGGTDDGEKDIESRRGKKAARRGINFKEVLQTLADPKCYLTALMFFSCNVAFSSVPVFLPTIIQQMGYSSLTSQALSAPPYIFSFIFVLLTAALSDRLRTRSPFLMLHSLLGFSGFALIAVIGYRESTSATSPANAPTIVNALRYLAIYPACVGFFSAVTLIIAWTLNNGGASASRRGAGVAVLNVVGQCGPLVGTRLFPESDAPYYARGMAACAGFMAAVGVLAAALRWVLVRENRRAVEKARAGGEGDEAEVPLVEGEGRGRKEEEVFLYML